MSKTITQSQRAAIEATGNVLVLAGAGSGKTSTLIERCLYYVLHSAQPISVTEMLIVTFTDAAAAELRKGLRERLESARLSADAATGARLDREIALIESAHISTLHSFCLHLVRQHFHEAGLDPSLVVLREEQAAVFIENALHGIMERHFDAATKDAERVRHLVEVYAAGDEERIRALVLKLHHYAQTLADPARWFSEQIANLQEESPKLWRAWLTQAIVDWCDLWGETLAHLGANRFAAQFCSRVKSARSGNPADFAALFADVVNAIDPVPWGFAPQRDEIHKFFDEAAFFQSLLQKTEGADPLAEDWEWVRGAMETLLRLAQEFSGEYGRLKRDHAAVDFHDLEQFALDLLTGKDRASLTHIAQDCRRLFKLVFVDEYQDINAAQDVILRAVAREGDAANRFLVGDIKQSIYRFRLADPAIFQAYNARWRQPTGEGKVIPLAENFRSAAPILQFVNSLFATLMHRELGGVQYELEAHLRPGPTARAHPHEPCVEVHWRLSEREDPHDDQESDENATETELEARLVARVLRQLRDNAHLVWDHRQNKKRPAAWRDMVVLLRSPRGRSEIFLKEFAKAAVPLVAPRGGLYDSAEVSDLLSLLQLLDNPLQDVPLLAVLRSPFVGLSLDELAAIRTRHPAGLFWGALNAWHRSRSTATLEEYSMWTKVDGFLQRFSRWRKMGRQTALSERLESMLRETQYLEWLLTQSRPTQRQANIRRFIELAGQFDPLQRQGLQRFLRFVQAQRQTEADGEPDSMETPDAVRLMSIHQSKGLEFPVVALAGLGVPFNLRDLREHILLDEQYGLCAHVKPPGFGASYPSLPWWLARRRQRREAIGEELRLLYVALTRARDTLLLFGSASRKAVEKWPERELNLTAIEDSRSPLMWLGPWCAQQAGSGWSAAPEGTTGLFRWRFHKDVDIAPLPPPAESAPPAANPARLAQLAQRLEWQYPWSASARESAKVSVSALREANEEAELRFHKRSAFRLRRDPSQLSAAEIGTAHHIFLQSIDLQNAHLAGTLQTQALALVRQQVLSPEQAQAINLQAVAAFWNSPVGQELRSHAKDVHREISFASRFTRADFIAASITTTLPDGEFVIVQGTVDLAMIHPAEIWLVDFKTDALSSQDLQTAVENYAPQLRIYASALARIYNRPVTKRWLHFLSPRETVAV
jgi:ATP-dependent helicase/nuclease subunit A